MLLMLWSPTCVSSSVTVSLVSSRNKEMCCYHRLQFKDGHNHHQMIFFEPEVTISVQQGGVLSYQLRLGNFVIPGLDI